MIFDKSQSCSFCGDTTHINSQIHQNPQETGSKKQQKQLEIQRANEKVTVVMGVGFIVT